MNPHYQKYIARGIARKNQNSIALNEGSRKHFVNYRSVAGFSMDVKHLAHTLHFKTAAGAYLTDLDGNRYLDLSMGFGVFLFGHNPAFFKKAIRETTDTDQVALGPLSPLAQEVAVKIQSITGVERTAFFNSGTEAIMVALRLARAATRKRKVVQFRGAYHGTLDSTLVFKVNHETHAGLPLVPGITERQLADTILLDYGTQEALEFIVANAHDIAAVLTEPVQSRNPSLQPAEFLKKLRIITENNSIALIFDEIVTGFRIHQAGAQHYFDVKADIVTYGKIIGGGMPIGVVCGKSRYLDFIDGGDWRYLDNSEPERRRTFVAGTFCQHPLSMAAASALLDELISHGPALQTQLNERMAAFAGKMNTWFYGHGVPLSIHFCASWFRFVLASKARYFYDHLLLEGIYIWEGRNCFLSCAHTANDLLFLERKIKTAALLLKAFGMGSSNVPPPTLISWTRVQQTTWELCAQDSDFDNASAIGVDLRLSGAIPELLCTALHFVLLHHVFAKGTISSEGLSIGTEITTHIERVPACEWDMRVAGLINGHLRRGGGMNVMIGECHDKATHLAFAVHKLVVDGYSLALIIRQLDEVLHALTEGKPLPSLPLWTTEDYDAERKKMDLSDAEAGIITYETNVFRQKVAISYPRLKKILRTRRLSIYGLLEETVTARFGPQDFGRPKAMQVSEVNHHLSGSFTTIEYGEIHESHVNAVLINVDKAIGHQQGFITEALPLNPRRAKCKLVINVMVARDHILVDYKYCPALRSEDEIVALHRDLLKRLTDDAA